MSNCEYGNFLEDGREYRVTNPLTPRPWINFLTNGRYCSLCSQVGGGFSFHLDHRFNAILERGIHQGTEDLPGRLVYIKDEDSGEIWNANAHPIPLCDSFEAHHGMGETRLRTAYRHIEAQLSFQVPPDDDAELWGIELRNGGSRSRRLSVYVFTAFSLGHQALFEMETPFHSLFNRVSRDGNGFTARQGFWAPQRSWAEGTAGWPWIVFMTTTKTPDALCLDRAAFLGTQRGYHNPQALECDVMPSVGSDGRLLCGAFQWRIALPAGETWKTHLALGVHARSGEAGLPARMRGYEQPETYAKAGRETRAYWDSFLSSLNVQTPDAGINRMVNTWNKKQLAVNFSFGRGPSYYHKGQYPVLRDSSQDTFGMTLLNPLLARANLLRLAGFFDSSGQPPGGCNRIGLPEKMAEKVDAPAWFALAIGDYIRETGEWALLDECVDLVDGGQSTLYDIAHGAMTRLMGETGPHGLCLIGKGDWNDAANAIGPEGRGESVWLSQFVCFAVDQLRPLIERKEGHAAAAKFTEGAEHLRAALREHAWAGEWFIRAFRDDGRPVGDGSENEGKLWLNAQTWAVLGSTDSRERLERALDACEEHLSTQWGLNKLWPAYTQPDASIGLITAFRPGWKENGAVFSHANAFHVVARALLGRGKAAVHLYRQLLPENHPSQKYLMEPYVYSQFCAGTGSGGDAGEGAYHWLSGTAAWMLRALVDYIFGVRSEYEGLRIDPAVDPEWKQFSLTRTFRGAQYKISFQNPDGVECGVREIRLDGQVLNGTLLPPPENSTHHVEVLMGV